MFPYLQQLFLYRNTFSNQSHEPLKRGQTGRSLTGLCKRDLGLAGKGECAMVKDCPYSFNRPVCINVMWCWRHLGKAAPSSDNLFLSNLLTHFTAPQALIKNTICPWNTALITMIKNRLCSVCWGVYTTKTTWHLLICLTSFLNFVRNFCYLDIIQRI